ncbi:putative sulfate exporter family transporter [Methylobacterium sp. DB1607]|nr:putative sulfate exporter family transporter [Methylobacterium sp. DB1607]
MTITAPRRPHLRSSLVTIERVLPGLALCFAVTAAAVGLESMEAQLFGRAWLEALVLAILLGTAVRTAWNPGRRFFPGIAFGAKTVLEVAVVLLGASLSVTTLLEAGPGLLAGIAAVVALAIAASYGIGRALGLHHRLAILVACGNSICGNSAIAATAPVIGADGEDVASSIAFTAVLGVLVVLGLPLLVPLFGLSPMQYGVLAGLTVYAVPQVLAATAPVAALSVQVGTLVKLVRVLMLGPVVLALSLGASRLREETDAPAPHVTAGDRPKSGRVAIHHLVPWFILAFLGVAASRSAGLIPQAALAPIAETANVLTIVSMAALGLTVDVRSVAGAGLQVTLAVVASLAALILVSLGLIRLLGIA